MSDEIAAITKPAGAKFNYNERVSRPIKRRSTAKSCVSARRRQQRYGGVVYGS
jgi:hypothetical protein